jgi:putative aminopeptidase FrvX
VLLKELTELNGVTGSEDAVRDYIKAAVAGYATSMKIDAMGNLIVFKQGRNPQFKVMLSAHMDEVGFMVVGYTDSGLLRFKNLGAVDERILPGKRVTVGDGRIPGVIGCKPIHLQEAEERNSNIRMKSLYIDIGADKKEEAEKLAPLGEYIAFDSEYLELGRDCIKAKALDDRAGCAVLMEALKGSYSFDLYACFTVQEEIGLRGSEVAAYTVAPDLALVVEGTTCSDVPGVEEYDYTTVLGNGAAITLMDRTSYPDKKLVSYLYDLAVSHSIPVQYKQTATGGNDAGIIHKSRAGVKTASISVPCRYIHSPVSVMSRKDFESVRDLVLTALQDFDRNPEKIGVVIKPE